MNPAGVSRTTDPVLKFTVVAAPWTVRLSLFPLVPRPIRPSGRVGAYHVLWDANWHLVPPEDPALLQHVGGDLYAVVAVWDLTGLERAVLSGRLRESRN